MESKPETPCELAAADGYAPAVGDRFNLPAGNYYDPISGTTKPTPEKNAIVTAMSMLGVTCEVDGEPMTVSREAFVMLAKNTMAHGAKLTRGHIADLSHADTTPKQKENSNGK